PEEWDLKWKPLYTVEVRDEFFKSCACIRLHFQYSEEKVKVFLGTLEGEVISTDWEQLKSNLEGVKKKQNQHCGQCVSLEPSPFFPDILLTAGDWTLNIWKDTAQVKS